MAGGRPKGSINAVSAAKREAAAKEGVMPLDYMLAVMRDPQADERRRDDMSKAAAPYLHAKLVSTTHSGPGGGPLPIKVEIEFVKASVAE